MTINDTHANKLNKSNRASQNVLLGTLLQQMQTEPIITGSMIIDASNTNYGLIVSQTGSGSSVRFGTATDNITIESDGSLFFSGSATVWDDIMFPLTTAKQGQTDNPPFNTDEVAYMFPAGDTSHIMYMVDQMPHSWKEGSTIHAHVHCSQGASGSPVFKLDYRWFNIGDVSSGSFATLTMSNRTQTWTSGCVHQLINNPAGINGAGKKISSIILLKLYRDDSAYTGAIPTYQFDIHYEKDRLGSRTELVK